MALTKEYSSKCRKPPICSTLAWLRIYSIAIPFCKSRSLCASSAAHSEKNPSTKCPRLAQFSREQPLPHYPNLHQQGFSYSLWKKNPHPVRSSSLSTTATTFPTTIPPPLPGLSLALFQDPINIGLIR